MSAAAVSGVETFYDDGQVRLIHADVLDAYLEIAVRHAGGQMMLVPSSQAPVPSDDAGEGADG